jgi:hypothetical protein
MLEAFLQIPTLDCHYLQIPLQVADEILLGHFIFASLFELLGEGLGLLLEGIHSRIIAAGTEVFFEGDEFIGLEEESGGVGAISDEPSQL